MLAIDLLNAYIQNHPYGIAKSTQDQLRYTMAGYIRFCGSCQPKEILRCDTANKWVDELRRTRKPDTVRTQRTNLLCLWWWAYRERFVEEPPLRLRRLRPLHRSPTAWTVDEVRQLLTAADSSSRPLFWSSLIRAGYDSGLRLGDLLALCIWQVSATVQVRQRKTGSPVAIQFRPETLEAIRMQVGDRSPTELVWPLWGRREAFYRAFRRLVAASGIRRGTFRWLRRTAATQTERVAPGSATALLGHASRSTTEQWYLDRSQLAHPPLPPW